MKISNFKLGIGLPLSFHLIPTAFFESFICMEKPDFVYIRPNAGDDTDQRQQRVDAMRNDLVDQALVIGCTQLLMMDTDQMYPVDALIRLLSHKRPAVGARIRRRYPPFDNLMFRGIPGAYLPVPEEECLSGGLVDVDATGAGCMLFDMQVFKKVRGPWFQTASLNGKPVGEDFGFCARLRQADVPIYVDTAVYLPHLTQMGITDSFAGLYLRVMEAVRAARPAPDPLEKAGIPTGPAHALQHAHG